MLLYGVKKMQSILKIIKNIFKLFIISTVVCSVITFALIIINAVMGIFIGLGYYFTLSSVLSVFMTSALVVLDYKRIFQGKSKKKINKVTKHKTIKRENNKQVLQSKRKIS